MNAKEFYTKFTSLVKENCIADDNRTYWEIYRTDESSFTKIINNTVVPEIIRNEGMEAQNEYFRIDTVGWITKYKDIDEDYSKRLGLSRHLWDLKIAVEHENSKSDWTDEVIKLAHIRCPLKVVIGYVHCDERTDIEREKLNFAYNCLSRTEAFDPNANEEFLIIFGNGAARHKANGSYDKFDYRGYILSPSASGFTELVL